MTRYTISMEVEVPDEADEAFERAIRNSNVAHALRSAVNEALHGKRALGDWERQDWVTDEIEESGEYEGSELYEFTPRYANLPVTIARGDGGPRRTVGASPVPRARRPRA